MRELAAPEARIRVPVAVTCRVLNLYRQHYYTWLRQPVTDVELAEAYVANALFDVHSQDAEFGYRLWHDEGTSSWPRGVWSHGVEDLLDQPVVVRVR